WRGAGSSFGSVLVGCGALRNGDRGSAIFRLNACGNLQRNSELRGRTCYQPEFAPAGRDRKHFEQGARKRQRLALPDCRGTARGPEAPKARSGNTASARRGEIGFGKSPVRNRRCTKEISRGALFRKPGRRQRGRILPRR